MLEGVRALEASGCEAFAVACNTAHHWAGELAASARIPMLHIADAAMAAMERLPVPPLRVGLLATRGTLAAAFYGERLARRGFQWMAPTEEEQAQFVDAAIARVKAGDAAGARAPFEAAAQGAGRPRRRGHPPRLHGAPARGARARAPPCRSSTRAGRSPRPSSRLPSREARKYPSPSPHAAPGLSAHRIHPGGFTMIRKSLAAVAALAVLAAAPATAQELTGTLKKIKDSGTITIGHRETSIPFSYLDDKQQPIGYSMDICAAVVEEVKKELGLAQLAVKYNPVTPQTRIPLMSNGTIDIECGSTTNTLTRQKQVGFAPITFITGTKLLVKKSSKIKSYKDLRNKTVVVTQGTTNERIIKALSDKDNLNIKFLNAKDHGESFLTVESGRAVAFSMDDILLYGLIAKAKSPKDFEVVGDYLSYDPYGMMYRKGDEDFGQVIRRAIAKLMSSGDINKLYNKWFLEKLPSGETMGVPMSPLLKAAITLQALPE